jgi:hypothetical protein
VDLVLWSFEATISASFAPDAEPFAAILLSDVGLICLWDGQVSTIPPGWQLCDGINDVGTPDLRDKFVIGGGGGYAPGSKGGLIHSKLTLENIPFHNHFKNVDKKEELPIVEEIIEFGSSSSHCVVVETRKVPKDPYLLQEKRLPRLSTLLRERV